MAKRKKKTARASKKTTRKKSARKATRKATGKATRKPKAKLETKEKIQMSQNGRARCARILRGKDGIDDHQCKSWVAPGSEFCWRHGGAAHHANLEKSVQNGEGVDIAKGLRRIVGGRFGQLMDFMMEELGDDDLSQELATLRVALSTQMEEVSVRYEEWKAEADSMSIEDRADYWRTYNTMLTRTRQTVESIRKIVQTIVDARAKQEGNTLTMVQVTLLVGELISEVTEIIGDDIDKLEELQSALNKLDWLPR